MRFRMLGPLEVQTGEDWTSIGAPKWRAVLARLLLERQEAGQLNVIDEGQAWHLCINPSACDELTAAYRAQSADR